MLLSACSDRPTPAQPEAATSATSFLPEQVPDHVRPGEQAFRDLARQVPAFAGFYLNGNRELVVLLTEPSRGEAMRAALVPVLQQLAVERNNPGARIPKIVFQKAEYSFAQLSEWRDRIAPIFDLEAVVLLDLDEQHNRLTVGLKDESGRPDVGARVRELGIPPRAVHLTVVGEPTSLAAGHTATASTSSQGCYSLQEYCRPLIGGYQISFLQDGKQGGCTLGFGAIRNGSELGFITNAHCSDDEWNLDYTPYYQPHNRFAQIGYESVDPRGWGFWSNCEFAYVCRDSDANFVRTGAGVEVDVGYIARTLGGGPFYVDPARPRLTITGTSKVYGGETVYMMGRTSGWLSGRIVKTCADIKKTWEARWHKVLCQDVHNGNIDYGDSGSPVFLWNGADHITLLGVNWGRNGITRDHTYYSPIANIRKDLGSLEVRAPGFRTHTGGGGGGGCGGGDPTVIVEPC